MEGSPHGEVRVGGGEDEGSDAGKFTVRICRVDHRPWLRIDDAELMRALVLEKTCRLLGTMEPLVELN